MPAYRLYCLDRQGKISSAEWLESDDDPSAMAAARALGKPTPCELWLRNRFVAGIEATLPPSNAGPTSRA